MMYHKCFYKYIIETSNPLATRPRYSRTCGAYWENLSKFCQGENTRNAMDRVRGASHRNESRFVEKTTILQDSLSCRI